MPDLLLKINLKLGGQNLNGYLNIDPISSAEGCVQHNLDNIEDLVDHNSASEFIANDVLDYLPIGMKQNVLTHWLTKISHGGSFIMTGTDIREAARLIHTGKVDMMTQGNNLLYGMGNNMWTLKKGLLTWEDAVNMIMSTGQFQVESMKFQDYKYVIKAVRN